MSAKPPSNKIKQPPSTPLIRAPAKGAIIGSVALPGLAYLAHSYLSSREAANSPLMHVPGTYKGVSFDPILDVPLFATAGSLLGAGIGKIVDTYSNKEASAMSLEDRVLLKMASCFSDEDVKTAIALSEQELSGVKLASEDEVQLALRDSVMQKLARSFSNEELESVIKQAEKDEKEDKDDKDEKKSKESKDKKDMKKESADMSVPVITPELAAQLARTLGAEKVASMVQQVQAEKEAEKVAAYHYELGQIMGQGLIDKLANAPLMLPAGTSPGARLSQLQSDVVHSAPAKAVQKAVSSAGSYGSNLLHALTQGAKGSGTASQFAGTAGYGAGAAHLLGQGATTLGPGLAAAGTGVALYHALKKKDGDEKSASQSDIYQALAVLESAGIDTKKLF